MAAAASFLTPIATPTNLMVMGPGGYAFGDYWKLGMPLMIWFLVVATFLSSARLEILTGSARTGNRQSVTGS